MADLYEYEALTDLDVDGVVGFRAGDGVPAEHVNRFGWKTDEHVKTRGREEPAPAAVEEPPARSASKADWVAYAVSLGMPADEAEQRTRDDLVTEYGA